METVYVWFQDLMGDKEIQEKMLIDQVELDRQMYQNISMRMNQADLTGQFTDNGILRIADVATPPDKALKQHLPTQWSDA